MKISATHRFNFLLKTVCVNNSFGVGCTEHCSPYCAGANKTCDVKSGSCDFGCVDGYYGTMCDRGKKIKSPFAWLKYKNVFVSFYFGLKI